uniref:Uncharacterized protein n=1 Tax=Caenorhabditis japonica TaxID=281687 RepID=A0A8R1ES97_CAEJA
MLPEWKLFELQDLAVKNSVVVPQANLDSRATSHRGRAMIQNGRGSSRGAGSLMTRGGHSDARGQSSHKRAKLF